MYAATHLRNANRVAVKLIHRELGPESTLRALFLREGYAANSVEHPATVRMLDDDTSDDGAVFLVMELLEGETLEARWQRNEHRLGPEEVALMMRELLDVLAAAHSKGIVHRDLKPENLFVTTSGQLKVLDFGMAHLCEASASRTLPAKVFGTPAFMPPEQALGRSSEVDALSTYGPLGRLPSPCFQVTTSTTATPRRTLSSTPRRGMHRRWRLSPPRCPSLSPGSSTGRSRSKRGTVSPTRGR